MGFFIPAAKITLRPDHKPITTSFSISANPNTHSVFAGGGIPARIEKVIVSGKSSASATGILEIPQNIAEGEITLNNLSGESIFLPAGTIVMVNGSADNKYSILSDVNLGKDVKTENVKIRAVSAGASFNSEAGTVTNIEKDYGLKITLVNQSAITGGTDKPVQAVSDEDYKRLKNDLITSLQPEARHLIIQKLHPGETLVGDMIQLVDVQKEDLDHPVGQTADGITLSLDVEFQGWVITDEDLKTIAGMNLASNLERGREFVPGSLSIKTLGAPVIHDDQITWQIEAMQESREILPLEDIRENIRGMTVPAALERLEKDFKFAVKPNIEMFPYGWPILPFYYMRINVVVN
ncbi:MAG: baseplate J/gp47 family protein [Anaerolineae bacterium]|nr:baseplate J/gp47 family protein [Anaerolineae bacterium]